MQCELSPAELDLITVILEIHQKTLIHDIARSDHRDYKDMLRRRLELLEMTLQKMKIAA